MSSVSTMIRLDTSNLDQIMKNLDKNTTAILNKAAGDMYTHIITSWSKVSPSAEGATPARVTGNLEGSIVIGTPRKGGEFTRYLGTDATSITIEARAEYAAALEYGSVRVGARPFMNPALQWLAQRYPKYFKDTLITFRAGVDRDGEREWSFYDRWEDNGAMNVGMG